MSKPIIGLFGTCGNSKWRVKFINKYKMKNIEFFNPLKADWKPEDSKVEAEHLINDDIVLFPITNETFGTASLAETGYSALSAIQSNSNRYVIIFIDPKVNELIHQENPTAAKESTNSRAIVSAHLKKMNHKNVFVVNSLDEMLTLSIRLYEVVQLLNVIKKDFK